MIHKILLWVCGTASILGILLYVIDKTTQKEFSLKLTLGLILGGVVVAILLALTEPKSDVATKGPIQNVDVQNNTNSPISGNIQTQNNYYITHDKSDDTEVLKDGQDKIQKQLSDLAEGVVSKEEIQELLSKFGQNLNMEIGDTKIKSTESKSEEYVETTDDHKKRRVATTITSGQTFFEDRDEHFDKKYANHKLGIIGFDFQDFTVRNSKYDSKIRGKIISAVGKLFSTSLPSNWRYRSLGDTYILYVPVLNEDELIKITKKIHIVLNSYDWKELDAELFLNTITTYVIIDRKDDIEDNLRSIFKTLNMQKSKGIAFGKPDQQVKSNEELYTLISYKKLKQ